MTLHCMLDLETLSSRKNAAIIQVAAVAFDPSTGAITSGFNQFIKEIPAYAHVDPGTIAWWFQQRPVALIGRGIDGGGPLRAVLLGFTEWYARSGCEAIWSHGATFDLPVLCSALAACEIPLPWRYSAERDTRTLYMLAGGMPKVPKDDNRTHDAAYDCEIQVREVVAALASLRARSAVA